jgi:competence protein ComEC
MRKKLLFLGLSFALLGGVVLFEYMQFYDSKLHVIFCDVGQGDAILIKTPENKYILVDSGPDRRVLDCLSRHMPFWQRNIELMLLTHPHADHFFGMFFLFERFHIKAFATENLDNKVASYQEFLRLIEEKQIPKRTVFAGDKLLLGDLILTIVAPSEDYLTQTSPGGMIGESKEFASLITHVQYGNFDVLLTGDSQANGLKNGFANVSEQIDVLQSPHHGSATGLDTDVLQAIHPSLAVVSVGAQNRYGHPSPKTLDLLQAQKIPFLRTDQAGDVEIISDGSSWNVKQ